MYPQRLPYPERTFANVSVFRRTRAQDYTDRPTLAALIARREAQEQYRRKFGFIPR